MAADRHAIHLPEDCYERLTSEATRRGVSPDILADQLIRSGTPHSEPSRELPRILAELREIAGSVAGPIDAVELVRAMRDGRPSPL